MKKKLALVVLLALALALPAAASQKSVAFGIKGGIDYANLDYNSDSGDPENLLGFGGGITLSTMIQPSVGIDLDFLYIGKGAKQEYRSGSSTESDVFTFETKLDYLVISPLLRLSPGRSGAGIYFLGGPEIGYLINATSTSSRNGSEDLESDLSDDFKDLDIGLSFGFGFQSAPVNAPGLFIESRYALGLTDVDNDSNDAEIGYDAQVKTRGIYLFGGLRF